MPDKPDDPTLGFDPTADGTTGAFSSSGEERAETRHQPRTGGDATEKIEPGPLPEVPGYEIEAELGRGGMGVVYKARQHALNRTVALKMVLAGAHAKADDLIRFLAEAETAAHLQHQGIVQIFESGRVGGLPYFTMEYVDGGSLADRLQRGSLPPAEAARVGLELAEAVAHAHADGVVHRDLKPSNILLTAAATPKITDFGLARRLEAGDGLTRTGTVMGTPSYMPPEQARGDLHKVGPLGDVYALGAILYEMLTGRPPFRSENPVRTLSLVLNAAPEKPRSLNAAVPRDLETIALKCLEKEPSKRYASAEALATDLRRFLDGRPVRARRVGPGERLWRWARRNPAVALLLVAVFAALAVGTVVSTAFGVRAAANADRADVNARELEKKVGEVEVARTELDAARLDALRKLEMSYAAQARARRRSGEPGHRYESLAALKEAAALAKQLGLPGEHLLDLRNEAIAAIALPIDLRVIARWPNPGPKHTSTVAFDPVLEHYATHTGGGSVAVVRVADGREVVRLQPPERAGGATLKFSPDRRHLAVGYINTDVPGHAGIEYRVWDWRERKMVLCHPAATHPQGDFNWSADGGHFRISRWFKPGELIVYRMPDGKQVAGNPVGEGWHDCGILPDGDRVMQVGTREGVVRDVWTGAVVTRWNLPAPSDRGRVRGDGRVFATAHGSYVSLWDAANLGTPFRNLVGHEGQIMSAGFNRRGDLVATTSWDSTIRFWDPYTGRQLLSLPGTATEVAFGPDDHRIGIRQGDGDVAVFELPHDGELRRARAVRPDGESTLDVSWSLDGRVFATAGWDGVRLWSADGLELARLTSTRATAVLFDPTGERFYALEPSRAVCWSLSGAGDRLAFGGPQATKLPLHTDRGIHPRIGMDRGGKRLAVSDHRNGFVLVFPGGNVAADPLLLDLREVWDAAVSPGGEWVAASEYQYAAKPEPVAARVWNARTGELAFTWPGRRSHVGFSPDGKWLVTGDADAYRFREVGTWKPREWSVVRQTDNPYIPGEFAFSPDGHLLAVAYSRWQVRLLDGGTGRQIATLAAEDDRPVRRLAFSPDGTRLVVARDGNLAHVWDLAAVAGQLDTLGLADGFPKRTRGPEGKTPAIVLPEPVKP